MNYRPLGRTGVQVSPLCLGTMMFGAWGNPDHDDSIRIIHRALDAGINFVDTADVYSAGESEEIVGKALKGRRDDVVLATKFFMPMGEDPNQPRRLAALDHPRGRELAAPAAAPTGSTSTRSTAPTRTPTSRRPSARSPTSSSRARSATSAPRRTPAGADRRGAVDRARPRPASASAPSSRRTRSSSAASSSTSCRPRSATAWASSPTARWPAAGCRAAGRADSSPTSPARQRLAARFDMSLPENQRKLDAVEQLAQLADDAGLPLIELAIAFVVNHPAVTSAIIGPRTMEQLDSQLPAADVALDAATSSTASTRSSRPASTSTPPTPATATTSSSPPPDAAEPEKTSINPGR